MKIVKIEIRLSPCDVNNAIKDYIRRETGKEVDEVHINLEPMTVGYGTGERTKYTFTGATAIQKGED